MLKKKLIGGLVAAAVLFSTTAVFAKNDKSIESLNHENLTVINTISKVTGRIGGFIDDAGAPAAPVDATEILYPISGDVFAAVVDDDTGETQGAYEVVGNISATAKFSTAFFGLMGDWSAIEQPLPWTMSNDLQMVVGGTTFTVINKFKDQPYNGGLNGRAFPQLGSLYDPKETGKMTLRMNGCAAIMANDEGYYAGKVGTLCLNGTFAFDHEFNGEGVSNCSIAIHDLW